jgi:hypothetical protein
MVKRNAKSQRRQQFKSRGSISLDQVNLSNSSRAQDQAQHQHCMTPNQPTVQL